MKKAKNPPRSLRLKARGESYYVISAAFYIKRDGPGKRPGGIVSTFHHECWGRDSAKAAVQHLRRAGCHDITVNLRTIYKAERTEYQKLMGPRKRR